MNETLSLHVLLGHFKEGEASAPKVMYGPHISQSQSCKYGELVSSS